MDQNICDLTLTHKTFIDAKRKWVKEHYTPESRYQYDTTEGILVLIDTIIKNKWIASDEKAKLQSLGISLGDALAQKLNLTWKSVQDEYGNDPCLVRDGTSITIFPLTLISKRIERGEDLDVYELFNSIVKKIKEIEQDL